MGENPWERENKQSWKATMPIIQHVMTAHRTDALPDFEPTLEVLMRTIHTPQPARAPEPAVCPNLPPV